MNTTFFGLLDTHVQTIIKADEGKDANKILLKTVKLLLDNIDYSDKALSEYQKLEMRQLFSSFSKVAQTACDFYRASKKHLDLEALNGELGKKLESECNEIVKIDALIESIEKNDANLLEREVEINKKLNYHNNIKEKISKLKEIEQTISDDALKTLDREMSELAETVKAYQTEKEALEKKINEYRITLVALSGAIAKENAEKRAIEENIVDTINAKHDIIQQIFTEKSQNLDSLKAGIEDYLKQYSRIENEFVKLQKLHSFYNLHLGENSKIVCKLKEYGILSIDALENEINRFKSAVGGELALFDNIIKGVLIEQEKLKEDVLRMQNKII